MDINKFIEERFEERDQQGLVAYFCSTDFPSGNRFCLESRDQKIRFEQKIKDEGGQVLTKKEYKSLQKAEQ